MPGITPKDMNGYDYDRGSRGGVMANGYDPYRDEYQREDPYRRDEEDIYRGQGRLGRFGGEYMDQSAEPSFELDHLATFAAATRDGYIQPEDGLRKLRQMESTTGIWTMRCTLSVERRHLVILDNQTGEELERFPLQSVHSPTAIFNKDGREIYNNLILFTVGEDPKKRTQADMHIFQSVDMPAQHIVDEIIASQKGGQRNSYPIQKPQGPSPGRDMYEFNGMREFVNTQQQNSRLFGGGPSRGMMVNRSYREEFEPGQNEVLERNVQLLNHCFDDIEKFVSRLQHAAESHKELEKRKRERNSKDKRRHAGEGLMGYRARPPPSSDFTDIFQKFKLSFNLLAKLKAHIHDPNAPELVHFLFTPLSLIYEASRDPAHGHQNLAESAIAPILTTEAKQLLLNCLTSKEIELWRALGSTWTTSRDEWKGYVPNYTPRFYDGWQPAPGAMENGFRPHADLESAALAQAAQARSRYEEEQARSFVSERVVPFPPEEGGSRYGRMGDYQRRDFERHSPRAITPPKHAMGNPGVAGYRENIRAQENQSRPETNSYQDENTTYLAELRSMGQVACEVIHDREGRNSKELTLAKGDVVRVLDSSRNWWKVRNSEGKVGFAPYTIMREIKEDEDYPSRDRPSSGNYNNFISTDRSTDAQYPPSELNRGKRAELSYDNSQPESRKNRAHDNFDNKISNKHVHDDKIIQRAYSPRNIPYSDDYRSHIERSPSPESYGNSQESITEQDFQHEDLGKINYQESNRMRHMKKPSTLNIDDRGVDSFHNKSEMTIYPDSLDKAQSSRGTEHSFQPIKQKGEMKPLQTVPDESLNFTKPKSYLSGHTRSDDLLRDELKRHVGNRPEKNRAAYHVNHLHPQSTEYEVIEWLHGKGFSQSVMNTFEGYTGEDMFNLRKEEIERLLGREDGHHLDSLLRIQKNLFGFSPIHGGSELQAILQKRKEKADNTRTSNQFGLAPDFRPDTPQQSVDGRTDVDDLEFENTGKTLRDLLIRQRLKIMKNTYHQQDDEDD